MARSTKRRELPVREQQRLKTLKANFTPKQRKAWASKAGKSSPTQFTSDAAKKANAKRWEDYYAKHPEKLKLKLAKEKER